MEQAMKNLIIVRGGGDLATGTIYKLKKSGFPVLILEAENPSAIRRNVAFCEAVYRGKQTVEDMTCYRAESLEQAKMLLRTSDMNISQIAAAVGYSDVLAFSAFFSKRKGCSPTAYRERVKHGDKGM
jgi:hypothetical protein